jgi:hypothetical protein
MAKQVDFLSLKKSGLNHLYKYTRFDRNSYYENLFENVLYFPNITQLNDPFDSQVTIRYDLCTEAQLDAILERSIPNYDENNFEQKMKKKIAKDEFRLNPKLMEERLFNFVQQRVGIFSLAESKDNLLLWSHYSDDHKGFCVEFDAVKLYNLLINVFIWQNVKTFIFKVEYQDEFPIIIPTIDNDEERLKKQFLIKSKAWEYEQEWRILVLDGTRENEIPEGVIKNIYLGLNAVEENEKICKALLKKYNPNVGLFKAQKKKNEFGLEFEKINF